MTFISIRIWWWIIKSINNWDTVLHAEFQIRFRFSWSDPDTGSGSGLWSEHPDTDSMHITSNNYHQWKFREKIIRTLILFGQIQIWLFICGSDPYPIHIGPDPRHCVSCRIKQYSSGGLQEKTMNEWGMNAEEKRKLSYDYFDFFFDIFSKGKTHPTSILSYF